MNDTEYSLCMAQMRRAEGQERYDLCGSILRMCKDAEREASDKPWGCDCSDKQIWQYRISELQRMRAFMRKILHTVPEHQCDPMWTTC